MNGLQLTADELDAVGTIQLPAAGDLTEGQLADWITAHVTLIAKTRRAPPARNST